MDILVPFMARSYLRRASSQPLGSTHSGHRRLVSLTHKAINGPASIPAVHSLFTNNNHGGEISFRAALEYFFRKMTRYRTSDPHVHFRRFGPASGGVTTAGGRKCKNDDPDVLTNLPSGGIEQCIFRWVFVADNTGIQLGCGAVTFRVINRHDMRCFRRAVAPTFWSPFVRISFPFICAYRHLLTIT